MDLKLVHLKTVKNVADKMLLKFMLEQSLANNKKITILDNFLDLCVKIEFNFII